MYIKDIKATRVLDSRGVPTIKTFVWTKDGVGSAIVPSGTSAGKKEACELRDGGVRYFGQDVSKAIKKINTTIKKKLVNSFVIDQKEIDQMLIDLDGTNNKSKLGGNAILSVSQAVLKAAANELQIPVHKYVAGLNKTKKQKMPIPHLNIINGGQHAGNNLSFQEFQIVPMFNSFEENIKASVEIYHTLKKDLEKKYGLSAINVGYEGGFCPQLESSFDALSLIQDAIDKCKYTKKVKLAVDAAANEFYVRNKYLVDGKEHTSLEMIDYYKKIIKEYKLVSIEDPFSEDDKKHWSCFLKEVSKTKVIGDDLLATNPRLIKDAVKKRYCNGLLLKINQIGTITEAIDAFNIAKKAEWNVQVSHRSGDTEDAFVADLAYGLASDSVKFGAPARGERTCKYNRLLEIEAFKNYSL